MLIEKIREDLQLATKNKDVVRMGALRLLVSALSYLEKTGKEFSENEELSVLKLEVKKRREAIEAYEKAGRPERVLQEKQELEVLEEYMPKQASDEEIRVVVEKIVAQMGGDNRGMIIGRVMGEIGKDKTDGNAVSKIVNEVLSK